MRTTNGKTTVYWGVTGLFAGLMLLSATMYLAGGQQVREGVAHLGYPAYLLVILGTAKFLGSLALLQSRVPTLREWAYAGFTINLLGATASHVFSGDPVGRAIVPMAALVVLGVSYVLQPKRRLIPTESVWRKSAVGA
jgi:hypothetical protein